MSRLRYLLPAALPFAFAGVLFAQTNIASQLTPDTKQPIDQSYTEKIKQYTTEPYFNSPLTDYLPASKTVPTPAKVLGDVSGAPGILPYAEDVYKYFRELAAATPRVRVVTIGIHRWLTVRLGRCIDENSADVEHRIGPDENIVRPGSHGRSSHTGH